MRATEKRDYVVRQREGKFRPSSSKFFGRLNTKAHLPALRYLKRTNPATDKSEAAILDRVFRPNLGDWPRAAADAILNIGFDSSDREQMAQLMEIAKDGELSREQAEELEHYRHIGRLLELMKSRARRSLQNTPPR